MMAIVVEGEDRVQMFNLTLQKPTRTRESIQYTAQDNNLE